MEKQSNENVETSVVLDDEQLDEQLTVEIPVEIRAGVAANYPCCRRLA